MRGSIPLMTLLILSSCTEPNPYLGICGNGVIEPDFDEECDNGASNGDSECSMECTVASCGDGLVQPGEDCDLGDLNSDDGECSLFCEFTTCGDGLVQPSEICDDGPDNRWPADGEPGCSPLCEALPYCGDGKTQPDIGEECDDDNDVDDDACSNTCVSSSCGDGTLQDGEECDDANEIDTDGCTNACSYATCGDGIVQEGTEECDDGNDIDDDACLTACLAATCGDGILQEGVEECDDGNVEPDDGCNAACLVDREVFVTLAPTEAAALMGIAGADTLCQDEAQLYGLAQPERFRAWLSDSKSSPATRFETRDARYVLVDGSVIADDWDDLTDGQLSHPINRSADGAEAEHPIWTSTQTSGEALETPAFCGDWSINGEGGAGVGSSSAVDVWWTDVPFDFFCFDIAHLYCFRD